ncbi:MAG TPA: CHAT domain-containing protein, partial [Sinorhizobium sp.]|nr:CHAT domain-containing protein [Sinorhizobium sp.]
KSLSREELDTPHVFETDDIDIEQLLAYLDLYAGKAEEMGLGGRALAFRQEALAKARARFGDAHPMTFEAALGLAQIREQTDPAGAVSDYRALDAAMLDWTRSNVTASGSLNGARAARILADDMLSAFAGFAVRNAEAAGDFAASLDSWKSLSRRAERELRQEAETTGDDNYRSLIHAYFNTFGRFREIVTASLYTEELSPLRQAMERSLNALNSERRVRGLPTITPWFHSERTEIPPAVEPDAGDVIVDLRVTRRWPTDRSGDPLTFEIHAVVSRHGRTHEVVPVDSISLEAGSPSDAALGKDLPRKLGGALFEAARGAKSLYVIPDDFLFQWPLAELRVKDGRRLGEIVDVHVATNRQAYAFRERESRFDRHKQALLVGGLLFDDAAEQPDLPSSLTEVEKIAALSRGAGRKVELLTRRTATEAKVRESTSGTAVLHFATHGFYSADTGSSAQLFNAGFNLSNATPGQGEREQDSDNIVYAREMLGWNLRQVDLVVIAACDTALGELGITSAVRGLPLALSVAGARRSLLTVDKVPDDATARFMIRFYEHLTAADMSYAQAFIRTKRDAWAGKIKGVSPELTYAYILFEH